MKKTLAKIAKELEFKSDIYHMGKRILSFEGKWVFDESNLYFVRNGKAEKIDCKQLTNGHGESIYKQYFDDNK
jgi:hypothetical protein